MMTNKARDLLLLAAVAFGKQQYSEAGALFASALASEDAPQMLEALNVLEVEQTVEQPVLAGAEPLKMSLKEIGQALSAAMEETVNEEQSDNTAIASDEDEDESEDDESEADDEEADVDEEEDEDELESDDFDPEEAGEKILPSSISSDVAPAPSTGVKRKAGASNLIISGINSPVKVKQ